MVGRYLSYVFLNQNWSLLFSFSTTLHSVPFPSFRTKLCIMLSSQNSPFIKILQKLQLYKGRLENGTYVAIRCLALYKRYSIRNLKLRLDLLAKLRHPNLVCLLGHCIDGAADDTDVSRVFLVYEFVPSGTLCSYLSGMVSKKDLRTDGWVDSQLHN